MPELRRLAMVAGEASGDVLAALLLGGLQRRWPAMQSVGIGGAPLEKLGFDAWWPSHKLAVNGYVEVLRHYREIVGIRRRLAARLEHDRPDLFIGVDAPDFNLDLERRLKQRGIKTVHFVSPSIWAWRGGRVHKIRAAVDEVLCLFPFEPALYAGHDVHATFVGHPLADTIPIDVPRAASRRTLNIGPDDTVVALLPGSRRSEVRNLAPLLLDAAAEMARRRPDLRFVLPAAPGLKPAIEVLATRQASLSLTVLEGRAHEALAACDVAVVASGTATLEAALFKRPMVVTYKVHPLSWQLMKRMSYLPWVGLPNILLGEAAVPELLQDAATPAALADATFGWLDEPQRAAALQLRFLALHHTLRRNTPKAAADAIEKVLSA